MSSQSPAWDHCDFSDYCTREDALGSCSESGIPMTDAFATCSPAGLYSSGSPRRERLLVAVPRALATVSACACSASILPMSHWHSLGARPTSSLSSGASSSGVSLAAFVPGWPFLALQVCSSGQGPRTFLSSK